MELELKNFQLLRSKVRAQRIFALNRPKTNYPLCLSLLVGMFSWILLQLIRVCGLKDYSKIYVHLFPPTPHFLHLTRRKVHSTINFIALSGHRRENHQRTFPLNFYRLVEFLSNKLPTAAPASHRGATVTLKARCGRGKTGEAIIAWADLASLAGQEEQDMNQESNQQRKLRTCLICCL